MMLADESTDEADRLHMSIFVRFVDTFDKKSVKRFLGVIELTTSKKAADLQEVILRHFESKNLDSLYIRFSGPDGTNAMSGNK